MNDPMASMMDRFAAMDERLRLLEGGQRAGLSNTVLDDRQAQQTLTSYGVDNWQDLGGNTPTLTVTTGRRALIFASFRAGNIGNPGAVVGVDDFKSIELVMGIQIDSTLPGDFATPTMRSQVIEFGAAGANPRASTSLVTFREDLVPGEHTFTMKFYSTLIYPANTVNPIVDDMQLCVTPLGPG